MNSRKYKYWARNLFPIQQTSEISKIESPSFNLSSTNKFPFWCEHVEYKINFYNTR